MLIFLRITELTLLTIFTSTSYGHSNKICRSHKRGQTLFIAFIDAKISVEGED